jgi:hypothetical protein
MASSVRIARLLTLDRVRADQSLGLSRHLLPISLAIEELPLFADGFA